MKLPEASARMLEVNVMVDHIGDLYRLVNHGPNACDLELFLDSGWEPEERSMIFIDDWREATPQELKEIGL